MHHLKERNNIIKGVVALVILAGAFYAGDRYASAKAPAGRGTFAGGGRGARAGMGFVTGQIIGKDDKSITVSSRDGSSKIVFVSASTQVMKAAPGSLVDLSNGAQVTVIGVTNSDGSVTAQSVQLRPAGDTGGLRQQ